MKDNQYKENLEDKAAWEKVAADDRNTHKTLEHDYRNRNKLIIVPMGDEHIGSKFYDEETHKRIVKWCCDTKTPVIHMGDMLETATKDSVGAGVFEQDLIVDKQIEKAVEIYTPLAKKGLLLGVHIGNHEARVYNHSGANLSKIMAKLLKVPYLSIGTLHYFMVGSERYEVYTTHGSSGARLPHTKIKSCLDLANMIMGVDVYCHAHLHNLDHHIRNCYKFNRKKRILEEKELHFVLTGSYLKHWGSYGHTKNYEPARRGSPKIKMSGIEHRVRVSL